MSMQMGNTVLIVPGGGETDLKLGEILNDAGVAVLLASGCAEAREVVAEFDVPCFLIPDVSLPGGTLAGVSGMAKEEERNISFIVLTSALDIPLYVGALEAESCEFIAPPFYHRDIAQLLKCAAIEGLAIQALAAA
jgi:DNA-binding NtrC family response regulator